MLNKKLTFVIERRSGTIPDIKWDKVSERELDFDSFRSSFIDFFEVLHDLSLGEKFRVIIYA